LDKPLHVIYEVSKLAYRILVILIANGSVKKNLYGKGNFLGTLVVITLVKNVILNTNNKFSKFRITVT
jgi:hypothetical protein